VRRSSRARALAAALAILATLVVPRAVPAVGGDEPEPPNVVVIMTDDQTLESMRVLPSVHALIGDAGVRFDQNIVTDALCCPSRATFLSGQYAFHHQVLTNDPPAGGYSAFDHSNALPVWLQSAGYRTIHLGKYLNHYSDEPPEVIPSGWDDWQALYPNEYFDYAINENGVVVPYGSAPEDYSTDVLAARAVRAIELSSPGGPFFLNLAPFAPHTTDDGFAVPPPRYEGAYAPEPLWQSPAFNEADVSDKPAHMQDLQSLKPAAIAEITSDYHAMLESLLAVDDLVQSVMTALVESGELDNTVVIFTADNGFEYGDHRIKSGKGRPYEESVRVPLMIRGPGFPAGTTVDALTANIDLAPTIAGVTGAVPLRPIDCVDLRSVLQDPGSYADRTVLLEGYASSPKTPCYLGVRTPHAAYWTFEDSEELYDLDADPYELDSLHADPDHAALRDDLATRMADLGPQTNPCQVMPPVVSVGDVSIAEPTSGGTAIASVSVRLDHALDYPLHLPYEVTLGTASSRDAVASTGDLLMGTGKTTATVKVKIKADVVTEPAETVLLSLLPPPGATYTVLRPTGTITILDRGAPASAVVAVGDVTVVETHAVGAGSVLVTVTLSQPRAEPTPVAYTLGDGDALRGSDYVQASGTVLIPANKLSATILVKVSPDVYEEPTESFFVMITPPLGIDADRSVGTVTILDDDVDP